MKHLHHHLQVWERVKMVYPASIDVLDPEHPELKVDWLLGEHEPLPHTAPYVWCMDCETEVAPKEMGMVDLEFY